MRLATVRLNNEEQTVIIRNDEVVLLRHLNERLNKEYPLSLLPLIETDLLQSLKRDCASLQQEDWDAVQKFSLDEVHFVAPYRNPTHIFGVGMNYVEKAQDLQATPVDHAPVCFLKPATSLIGMNESIVLPRVSKRVTAEGELSLIIGKRCFEVSEEEALDYVIGYTASLDLTASDIHAQNPRFIQMSKLCKGFFSFGPEINLLGHASELDSLFVETVQNGEVVHRNSVQNMIYRPAFIVSYISKFIELQPGDIIMTGTPGSFSVTKGDVAACRITGLHALQNEVI